MCLEKCYEKKVVRLFLPCLGICLGSKKEKEREWVKFGLAWRTRRRTKEDQEKVEEEEEEGGLEGLESISSCNLILEFSLEV